MDDAERDMYNGARDLVPDQLSAGEIRANEEAARKEYMEKMEREMG